MIWHDDVRMQEELPLIAIVEEGLLKQLPCGRDLKKAAALSRHCRNQVRAGFLRREPHASSINQRPRPKGRIDLCVRFQEPEGSCSLRMNPRSQKRDLGQPAYYLMECYARRIDNERYRH